MSDAEVWYMAHPVGAPTKAEVDANIQRALRWLNWLRKREPKRVVIAPWIASILAGEDDADPAQRERGLQDAEAIATRVDGIVMCGGRISTGMDRESTAVCQNGGLGADLTSLGAEPPDWPLPGDDDFDSPINHGMVRWEAP